MTTCRVCSADETDLLLCTHCTEQLETVLSELPALIAELDITASRQDRGVHHALFTIRRTRIQRAGVHYDEGDNALPATPWAFAWDAADQAWAARHTLATWCLHIARSGRATRPLPGSGRVASPPCGPACLACTHSSCIQARMRPQWHRRDTLVALWLIEQLPAIRLDEHAGQLHDELTWLHGECQQRVDRPEPLLDAGLCDAPDVRAELIDGAVVPVVSTCGAPLRMRPDAEKVTCQQCGQTYDGAERRRLVLDGLEDKWLTATLLAEALSELDCPVKAATIRKWAERGRVVQVGIDDRRDPLYRVGDVRARVVAMQERAAAAQREAMVRRDNARMTA